jgi:hypothetical protein
MKGKRSSQTAFQPVFLLPKKYSPYYNKCYVLKPKYKSNYHIIFGTEFGSNMVIRHFCLKWGISNL